MYATKLSKRKFLQLNMVLVAWASKPVKPVKLFTPRF